MFSIFPRTPLNFLKTITREIELSFSDYFPYVFAKIRQKRKYPHGRSTTNSTLTQTTNCEIYNLQAPMYSLQTMQAKNNRDHQHAGGSTARDPDRIGESSAQGAARMAKRAHSEAFKATSQSTLPPKKRRILSYDTNVVKQRRPKHSDVCYACDLDVKTVGNTTRKGYRKIEGELRTVCHFCFGNIHKVLGMSNKTNYLVDHADSPELLLDSMDRSELIDKMNNERINRELMTKRKPAEDLSESVERIKRAKTEVCSLFGYNHPLSNPAFVTNLTAAFHSHVQKHGKPDTRWKHWKGIGLVALRETYKDFYKCPKKCTGLGNRVKIMLVNLGLLD